MIVKVGSAAPFTGNLSDASEMDLLSDAAAEHVRRNDGIHLDWDLTLTLLALYHADGSDREPLLYARLPTWLEDEDVELLTQAVLDVGLPPRSSFDFEFRTTGQAGRPSFGLKTVWLIDGETLTRPPEIAEGLMVHAGNQYRLTLGQLELRGLLAAVGEVGRSRSADLRLVGRLKRAVQADPSGVVLDRALERQDITSVDRLQPRLRKTDDGYVLGGHATGVDDPELDRFAEQVLPSRPNQEIVTVRTPEGRQRVVLGDEAHAALTHVSETGPMTAAEVAHVLSHPAETLPASFDLSEFSERVIGFGIPVANATPLLREFKGQNWYSWELDLALDGAEDDGGPGVTASLKDPAIRETIKSCIRHADERGDKFIPNPVGEGLIEVTTHLREAVEAAEILAQAETNGKLDKPPKQVLLVHDNLEWIAFDRAQAPVRSESAQLPQPPGLRQPFALYEYQLEGVAWLNSLWHHDAAGWKGALLADDMGLGKTLQVLSFFSCLLEKGVTGPHLIVAPVALLLNWEQEATRFFGGRIHPIHRFSAARFKGLELEAVLATLNAQRLVMVSYEALRRSEEVFARVRWASVVMDEAQKAKNPGTQIARVVRTLNARFRLAITGTPIENSLGELWTIYDWALPGLLGSLQEFRKGYSKPLQDADDSERLQLATSLQATIEPVFMRRMKRDVLAGLPELRHEALQVPLSPLQEERYQRILLEMQREAVVPVAALQLLFAISAHPDLEPGADLLPELGDQPFPKGQQLFELLTRIRARAEKVLVFAGRRLVQRWIAEEARARFGGSVHIVNGDVTSSAKRMKLIEQFSEAAGFGVLVLAPRAAGVGLNITAANHVVHYMREWNPAVERQATDRAYRIGQARKVTVYTITTTSPRGRTVEERLDDLLTSKQQLSEEFVIPMSGLTVSADELLS